jgi:pre-mRNA-processing factor 6
LNSYVAGLSRGAAGFTTRSDIGPAREISSFEAGVGGQEGAPPAAAADGADAGDDGDDRFQNPEEETGLFAGMAYDKDDEEADQIYDQVQAKMAERRRLKRERREQDEAAEYLKANPRIQDRFTDLKRELAEVSDFQWEK